MERRAGDRVALAAFGAHRCRPMVRPNAANFVQRKFGLLVYAMYRCPASGFRLSPSAIPMAGTKRLAAVLSVRALLGCV